MDQNSIEPFACSAGVTSEIPNISRYASTELAPPVVGSDVLRGSLVGFLEFLLDESFTDYRVVLFGHDRSAVATALQDFRKATEFHYFGHRSHKPGRAPSRNPGLLNATKAESKRALKEFTQLAYRGDPERRGLPFWKRITGLLWEAYASLMKLRLQAEKIGLQETTRIEQMRQKREARAAYMRRYRANNHVKCQPDDVRATDASNTNTSDGNAKAVKATDVKELTQ